MVWVIKDDCKRNINGFVSRKCFRKSGSNLLSDSY